jgi:hypothetical protein
MICEEDFVNVFQGEKAVGFSFLARLPYYRGLGLSMIEDVGVVIDGQVIPRNDIRLTFRGLTWTLDEMETEYSDRWNFGEKAQVTVLFPGGLEPGPHEIELSERLRISYLPFIPTTKAKKTIRLQTSPSQTGVASSA